MLVNNLLGALIGLLVGIGFIAWIEYTKGD